MGQIGWMISLIPDSVLIWIINTVLLAGAVSTVAGFFIKFIPFVNQYRTPIQIIGVALLTAGVYFKGGYGVEMMWRERVAELEKQVAAAEEKSELLNIDLEEERKRKNKVITETKIVIQEQIREKEKIINAECKVPEQAIDILNNSAKTIKKDKK
jgi:hypothetical protein